jgi:hypothetical protein
MYCVCVRVFHTSLHTCALQGVLPRYRRSNRPLRVWHWSGRHYVQNLKKVHMRMQDTLKYQGAHADGSSDIGAYMRAQGTLATAC